MVWDLIIGAGDTVATGLQWFFLYMANYPVVQKKLQEEIDRVIGRDRAPTLSDRLNMPYLEACTLEALRLGSPTSVGVPRRVLKSVDVAGFHIPQDYLVMAAMHVIHRDP